MSGSKSRQDDEQAGGCAGVYFLAFSLSGPVPSLTARLASRPASVAHQRRGQPIYRAHYVPKGSETHRSDRTRTPPKHALKPKRATRKAAVKGRSPDPERSERVDGRRRRSYLATVPAVDPAWTMKRTLGGVAAIEVRRARSGDGKALARIHADMAAYYVERFPAHFRMPRLDGLDDELDAELVAGGDSTLRLVAEVDGVDERAQSAAVPFWTERMGYEARSVNLRKRL